MSTFTILAKLAKRLKKQLTFVFSINSACLLMLTPATADDDLDWYHVEMVVFEYTDKTVLDDEKWPIDVASPHHNAIVRLQLPRPETNPFLAFHAGPPDTPVMEGTVRALNRAKSYRVLSHTAWQQPALPLRQAKAVYVIGGDNQYDDSLEEYNHMFFDDRLGYELDRPLYEMVEQFQPSLWELEGSVTISISQPYLNVEADFIRYYPLPDLDYDDTAQYQRLSIYTNKRVRTDRLYYFDHPHVGILLKIMPTDTPALAVIEEDAETQTSDLALRPPLIFSQNVNPSTPLDTVE